MIYYSREETFKKCKMKNQGGLRNRGRRNQKMNGPWKIK
jgi:hypothetical protein